MNVLELVAKLGVEIDKNSFTGAMARLGFLRQGFLAVGEVVSAAGIVLKAFTTDLVEDADHIATLAEKLGISTDAVQELGHAARLSDTDIGSMEQGLKFLAINADKAASGSKEAAEYFKRIGVSVKDASGKMKPLDALLRDVATGVKGLDNQAAQTNVAQSIFGKGGTDLLVMLRKGGDEIARMQEEAKKFGLFSKEDVEVGAAIDDELIRLQAAFHSLKVSVGGPLLRALLPALKGFTDFIKANGALIRSGIVNFFSALGAALVTVGKALKVVAIAATVLGVAFAALNLGAIISGILGAAAALGVLAAKGFVFAAGFAVAFAPVIALGAALAAVALILEDIYVYTQGGNSVFGKFVETWDNWKPKDGSFLSVLKAAGELLVDLANGDRLDRLADSIGNLIESITSPLTTLLDSLGLLKPLGEAAFGDLRGLQVNTSARLPQEYFAPATSNVSSNANNITNSFVINAPPGSDGRQIGEVVADEMRRMIQESGTAVIR